MFGRWGFGCSKKGVFSYSIIDQVYPLFAPLENISIMETDLEPKDYEGSYIDNLAA